jgi:predicted ATPase with chaperone activity
MTMLSAQISRSTEPTTVAELGVDRGIMLDLVLKTMFYRGRLTQQELGDELRLSNSVMQELLQALNADQLVDVKGSVGSGPSGYVYSLTDKGLDRAQAALERSGYVGPAPVSLAQYVMQVQAQSIMEAWVAPESITQALSPLILSEPTMRRIGRAAVSKRATLVYGASGNGKTTVVRAIGSAIEGGIRIPYAIEMVGQIVHLYDSSKHEMIDEPEETYGEESPMRVVRHDRRWVAVRRPVIWAGGELTKHSLELVYDDRTRVYEAPLQLKANGGTLIIDDFGRQQIPAVQLLNRWIVALEGGIDHLTLHTGQTIEIPFDVLVLFSTNLPPEELADEAFLRRIRYKVEVPDPTRDEYERIMRAECAARGIAYDPAAVQSLFAEWYERDGRALRGCHPRDIIEAVVDAARFEGRAPALTPEAIDDACSTYFLRARPRDGEVS